MAQVALEFENTPRPPPYSPHGVAGGGWRIKPLILYHLDPRHYWCVKTFARKQRKDSHVTGNEVARAEIL